VGAATDLAFCENCALRDTPHHKTVRKRDEARASLVKHKIHGFMVHGLSRDYWPVGAKHVVLRTVLAFVLSPVFAAAVTVLAMVVLEIALSRDFDIAAMRSPQVAPMVLVGSFILAFTVGAVAFLALWALRLRGRLAYALAGVMLGFLFAICTPFFGLPPVGPVPVIVMSVHFALFMLIFRAIAGVRRIDG